jgi:hypothetical protein
VRNQETMRLAFILAATGFLIALVYVDGQNTDSALRPPPLFPTNEFGPVSHDCQVALRFPKLEYTAGEPIHAAVILRNVGSQEIGFIYAGDYFTYDLTVERKDAQTVPYSEFWAQNKDHLQLAFRGASMIPVEPHADQPYPLWINVTDRYKFDSPGDYVLIVTQKLDLVEIVSQHPYQKKQIGLFDLVSNPVTITVVPKPEK